MGLIMSFLSPMGSQSTCVWLSSQWNYRPRELKRGAIALDHSIIIYPIEVMLTLLGVNRNEYQASHPGEFSCFYSNLTSTIAFTGNRWSSDN
jgi:hypothetical protein